MMRRSKSAIVIPRRADSAARNSCCGTVKLTESRILTAMHHIYTIPEPCQGSGSPQRAVRRLEVSRVPGKGATAPGDALGDGLGPVQTAEATHSRPEASTTGRGAVAGRKLEQGLRGNQAGSPMLNCVSKICLDLSRFCGTINPPH
jgi:hypothetical protein